MEKLLNIKKPDFLQEEEVLTGKCHRCESEVRIAADVLKFFGGPKYCFDCVEILKKEEKARKKSSRVFECMLNFIIPHNLRLKPKSKDPNEYGLIDHTLTESQESALKLFKEGHSIYIWGGIGSGKTYVACKCAVSKVFKGIETFFVSATKFRKSSYFTQEDDMGNYISKQCLLVDDLGNYTITQNVVSDILNLLSHRINEGLPTIFTSNYNPVQLAARLKTGGGKTVDPVMCDAIADRVLELCKVVKVDGKSFRVDKFLKELRDK